MWREGVWIGCKVLPAARAAAQHLRSLRMHCSNLTTSATSGSVRGGEIRGREIRGREGGREGGLSIGGRGQGVV